MSTRDRLASMAERMIGRFREKSYFRFYKGTYSHDDEFESPEINFDKNNYTQFVGIIIDIYPQELVKINDSNIYDLKNLSKLYTNAEINFEIKDRVSLEGSFFEIINIDSSVGYKTLILRGLEWR
ncbi:Putative cytosolic protein (plasmid) [Borrelia hermsii YBT]|uniref:Putative cytosolic protein n=1 Tax=Borrelia hermsii YBT TaxID=1313295 RepID=W5T1U4_BORHE|nr:DUF1506 family protein [Borrelia hermsii]AHH13225.1 Putative cytosolic protein [Borrelia hermsii YBT]